MRVCFLLTGTEDMDDVASPHSSLSTPSRSLKIIKEKVAVTPKRLRKNVSSVESPPFIQNPVSVRLTVGGREGGRGGVASTLYYSMSGIKVYIQCLLFQCA